jgi:predicted DNA-binding transcriptional regulator AlpA
MMAEQKFPAQVPLSERAVGWVEGDVAEWIQGRILQARKRVAPGRAPAQMVA